FEGGRGPRAGRGGGRGRGRPVRTRVRVRLWTREGERPQHWRMVPVNMTAIEIREPGPPQVLRAARRPVPQPKAGEVLIKVAAAGVNRPDVLQRKAAYAPPPGASAIPGLKEAGAVGAAAEGGPEPEAGAGACAP